jgi:hypothetical protein
MRTTREVDEELSRQRQKKGANKSCERLRSANLR